MPHKRAKRSVRDADKKAQGENNAPTKKSEGTDAEHTAKYGGLSNKVYRILNAEQIRKEKKERDALKRKRDEDGTDAGPSARGSGAARPVKQLKIMPGEKLKNFNSRVEEAMRTDMSSAIRQSKNAKKKTKLSRAAAAKAQAEADEAALLRPPPRRDETGKAKERASDFNERERVKLNDVAMEPPSLKFGSSSNKMAAAASKAKKDLPVSMKQKQEMEEERQRAIEQYRNLKARQLAERQ